MEDTQVDDICCLTCRFAEPKNEDEWGNPEFVICNLKMKEMAIDGFCTQYD